MDVLSAFLPQAPERDEGRSGIAQIEQTVRMMGQASKWRPLKSSSARHFRFSARAVKIINGLSD